MISAVSRKTLNTAYNLDRAQFEVAVAVRLAGGYQGLDNVLAREAVRVPDLTMFDIRDIKKIAAPWQDVRAFKTIYRVTRAGRFDIVHTTPPRPGSSHGLRLDWLERQSSSIPPTGGH